MFAISEPCNTNPEIRFTEHSEEMLHLMKVVRKCWIGTMQENCKIKLLGVWDIV